MRREEEGEMRKVSEREATSYESILTSSHQHPDQKVRMFLPQFGTYA